MSQIVAASTSAGFTLPAGSSLNVSGSGIVHITPPGQNLREIVLNGAAQMVGPYRFDAYIGLIATATAALSYDVTVGYGTVGDPVTVPSISQAGLTVTATLAIGWIATGGWQWKRVAPNGTITDISGAINASYTQQAADLVAGTRIYPQPIGLTFAPYGITADGTVVVTPTPGTIGLSAATYSVGEAAGSVTVLVQRSGGSSGAASVQVATSSGSATSGADFTAVSLTLNWADGDAATKNVVIPIINDTAVEGNETFNVTLSAATGATLGSPASAVVTIVDDDVADTTPPTISSRAVANASPTHIDIVFSEAVSMASGATPAPSDFAVAGGTHVPTAFTFVDSTHAYLSIPAVVNGETLTLSYSGNKLQDVAGNLMAAFSGAAITNNVGASVSDTKPRYVNGTANSAGTSSVFDNFFPGATDLGGSTNGGKAGTVTVLADSTRYGWMFIPSAADASGIHVVDGSNAPGGWSGATSAAINGNGDPTDPITVRQLYTDASGNTWHAYRTNGKASAASYTVS